MNGKIEKFVTEDSDEVQAVDSSGARESESGDALEEDSPIDNEPSTRELLIKSGVSPSAVFSPETFAVVEDGEKARNRRLDILQAKQLRYGSAIGDVLDETRKSKKPRVRPYEDAISKFKVGDNVTHKGYGAGEVVEIEQNVGGTFYVIKMAVKGNIHKVPVGRRGERDLHGIISKQQVREVYEILCDETPQDEIPVFSRRFRDMRNILSNGSIFAHAALMRDLYRRRLKGRLSPGEVEIFEKVQRIVVSEIALATGQPEEEVLQSIEKIFLR